MHSDGQPPSLFIAHVKIEMFRATPDDAISLGTGITEIWQSAIVGNL